MCPRSRFATSATAVEKGIQEQAKWERRFDAYAKEHPDLADAVAHAGQGRAAGGLGLRAARRWKAGESLATRVASGKSINAIATTVP